MRNHPTLPSSPTPRRRATALAAFAALALSALAPLADAGATQVRIKDIADFEGVRDNMLLGYGLVVGLNGTGDSLNNSPFTRQSLEAMLERLGVNTRGGSTNTDNVAAVMVTGTLPAFARQGTRIDVTVNSLGDASNLQGGMLLVTPLLGADGEVYAVAQGSVAVSGFAAQGAAGTSVVQGVPTAGRIANGAIVEREVGFELADLDRVTVSLRNPDLTTSRRVAVAINATLGRAVAKALDPSTVSIAVPDSYSDRLVDLMTDIEQLRIEPDQVARVIIDEVSGTIVMGENVRISTVAIAKGNLTIRITETPQVSQPQPFSNTGETAVVPRTDVKVDEGQDKKLGMLNKGVTLQELVNGINALGIGPRDMITILQAIKAAGALQAEIEVL